MAPGPFFRSKREDGTPARQPPVEEERLLRGATSFPYCSSLGAGANLTDPDVYYDTDSAHTISWAFGKGGSTLQTKAPKAIPDPSGAGVLRDRFRGGLCIAAPNSPCRCVGWPWAASGSLCPVRRVLPGGGRALKREVRYLPGRHPGVASVINFRPRSRGLGQGGGDEDHHDAVPTL